MTSKPCRCCGESALETILDLGPQPICSHLLGDAASSAARHPLALARCLRCGQIQLLDPAPVSLLRSPHPWLTYIEPEGHLDKLVEELIARPGAGPHWRVSGVTYKDASTLARFQQQGWTQCWQLDPAQDLDIADGTTDLAIVQAQLTPERARRAAERHGRADIVLVRHLLEHAHDPRRFLAAIKELVAPGGVAVFECPDSQRAFLHRDYTVVWEEHALYFTAPLFARFFRHGGMRLERLRVFPYAVENSLVAIVRTEAAGAAPRTSESELQGERETLQRYADDFPRQREAWQRWSETGGRRIAAFGAGHATCAFINFFGLASKIEFVADDHPKKQGLFLPGSTAPIRPSTTLETAGVETCLLGLSPESEARVLTRLETARTKGVQFVSIFPLSELVPAEMKRRVDPTKDVMHLDRTLPQAGDTVVAELRRVVGATTRKRARFCAHASPDDPLHEMIICVHADSYVRPHRHRGKAESVHVIAGQADLVIFDEAGEITRVIPLGPQGAGCTWYARLPEQVFHTLVLRGEDFVFHETTLGPFRAEDTEPGPWAPDERDEAAVAVYRCGLVGDVLTWLAAREDLS
jgi:cupin fold WbuC family metalloprotein